MKQIYSKCGALIRGIVLLGKIDEPLQPWTAGERKCFNFGAFGMNPKGKRLPARLLTGGYSATLFWEAG
ncbi:MAG: hypothetical protein EBZ62_07220 [Sphingobacteriia bacterium]|nr:hypothetical protein [Sphingobacteriia bacterium]